MPQRMKGRKSEPHLISLTPWRTYPCKWEAPQTRSFISCQKITGLAVKFMSSTWEDVKAHGSLEAVFGCDRHQAIQSRVRWPLQHPPAPHTEPSGSGKPLSVFLVFGGHPSQSAGRLPKGLGDRAVNFLKIHDRTHAHWILCLKSVD